MRPLADSLLQQLIVTYWYGFHLVQKSTEQAQQFCRTRHSADKVIEHMPASLTAAVSHTQSIHSM